jgi:hypothetical protein
MLRITVTKDRGRGSVATTRTIARGLLRILQRNTPKNTGELASGWYIDYVAATGFALQDDVYYGYWVNNGNTKGLKARRFVERSIQQYRSQLRGYTVDFEAVEE